MKHSHPYDAIVVLGYKLNADGSPKEQLIDRLKRAVDCYRQGASHTIITCGGQTPKTPNTEAEQMKNWLIGHEVPPGAIRCEDRSQITCENLMNAKQMITKEEHPRILLVTSDYHMFRASWIARSLGFRVHGCKAPMMPSPEKRLARKREPIYWLNYVMGWETGRKKQPQWFAAAIRKIK